MNALQKLDDDVLQQCMRCGLCLPACPTFAETGQERHGPRGRIALMRAVARGEMGLSQGFGEEMYACLGCLACASACPAGVDYATMLGAARSAVEESGVLGAGRPGRGFWRWVALKALFLRPGRLRAAARALRFWQHSGLRTAAARLGLLRLLPEKWRRLEAMAPQWSEKFSEELIAEREGPAGARYRVGLLTGCVQDLALAQVNRDTADALLANGCAVFTPRGQPCCGSLHAHQGAPESAAALARRLVDLFPAEELEAVITNAGGCGSHLQQVDRLLAGDAAYAERARAWVAKVRDVNEFLAQIGARRAERAAEDGGSQILVAYQESCHLAHGQGVRAAPRAVLGLAPGLRVVELRGAEWCCGSAGVYNVTHPAEADRLLARKLEQIAASGAQVVATANPGCHLQLAGGLRARGLAGAVRVAHPVSLLAEAYRAERPRES